MGILSTIFQHLIGKMSSNDSSDSSDEQIEEDKLKKYKFIKQIGVGTTGRIDLYQNTETKKECAIKTMNLPEEHQRYDDFVEKQIQSEVLALTKLKGHKNIIELYEVIERNTVENSQICLVLEFCKDGDLVDQIGDEKLDENLGKNYFKQMIEGVSFIHQQGFCHRDLKPENILFSKGTVKISDFGWCTEIKKNKMLNMIAGTPSYAAPEVLMGKSYDGKKADIWSLGICLYTMLTGCFAFDNENIDELIQDIVKLKYPPPTFLSKEAQDLIKKLLVIDPNQRLTLEEIKSHPWMK